MPDAPIGLSTSSYPVARVVAATVHEHFQQHRQTVDPLLRDETAALLPRPDVIETIIDAAFWTSLRREEGYVPRISLAFVEPREELHPMRFARPLALDPTALTRIAPAVERPGIHLGVWPHGEHLAVWGTTRMIPPLCFVVEVVAPGLIVVKHRPRLESRKFVNVAVLEGDQIKIVDERALTLPDCPGLLTSLMGFETQGSALNVLVQLAVSMRRHGRGGTLLVVPTGNGSWQDSIVHPIAYAVEPAFHELAKLATQQAPESVDQEWLDAVGRAVDHLAGLTAVDGAVLMTEAYDVLAFGAKISRRKGGTQVDQVVLTEPVDGNLPVHVHPGQLGGTRHLSAAQFVRDQPDAVALVASQDGRFTIFAWSPCDQIVYAHRVESLLM
jgi:hypothetical protein